MFIFCVSFVILQKRLRMKSELKLFILRRIRVNRLKKTYLLVFLILTFTVFGEQYEDNLVVTHDDFDNITWYEDQNHNIKVGSYPSTGLSYNIYLRCKVLENGSKKLYLYIAGLQTIEKLIINIDKVNYEYITYDDKSGTVGLVDLINTESELKIIGLLTKSDNVKLRASNSWVYTDIVLDESQLESMRNVFRFYIK